MKQFNPHEFYTLATIIHPLTELEAKKFNEIVLPIWTAKTSVYNLTQGNPLPLPVAKPAANKLWWALDAVVNSDHSKWNMEEEVSAWKIATIKTAARELETVLSAEVQGCSVYYVSQQLIYNTADLIDRAENALGDAVNRVSDSVKRDFNAAGRALAFELATGSGFHTMRATEAVLRDYHRLVVGLSRAQPSPIMHTCIQQLRARGEDPKLMDILDHIRDLHRNTLMHPEAFLSMPEALRLFDIAKSAINAMAERIESLKAHLPATPAGPVVIPKLSSTKKRTRKKGTVEALPNPA